VPEIRMSPFRRTRKLVGQIDAFLDLASEAGMAFEEGLRRYLECGVDEVVERKMEQIGAIESQGDDLRRTIELTLFTQMLIPDVRGDVLSVLNDLDLLVDLVKVNFLTLTIQKPDLPESMCDDFGALATAVVASLEAMVHAARAYFRDPGAVRDHIHKIGYYESEADRIGIRMRKALWDSDMPLDRKTYLDRAIIAVDQLANAAEDAGDRLAIYSVKRSL